MTNRTEHIEFETMNDYVDGRLDESEGEAVERHLRACSACSSEHRTLVAVLGHVTELPRSVLPEVDGWADLKTALEQRKEVVLPIPGRDEGTFLSRGGNARNGTRVRVWLAVAAMLLVVLSSGITAIVLRSGDRSSDRAQMLPPDSATGGGAPTMLPASFRSTEGEYARTIDELRLAFEAQRGQLAPETVRTVERSLSLIDAAITEARDALVADPGNQTLVDLLSANYQRKLDLLRRTSELSSRI
jgi:hypothetical protein